MAGALLNKPLLDEILLDKLLLDKLLLNENEKLEVFLIVVFCKGAELHVNVMGRLPFMSVCCCVVAILQEGVIVVERPRHPQRRSY